MKVLNIDKEKSEITLNTNIKKLHLVTYFAGEYLCQMIEHLRKRKENYSIYENNYLHAANIFKFITKLYNKEAEPVDKRYIYIKEYNSDDDTIILAGDFNELSGFIYCIDERCSIALATQNSDVNYLRLCKEIRNHISDLKDKLIPLSDNHSPFIFG